MLKQQNARDPLQFKTVSSVPVLGLEFSCVRVCIHDRGLLLEILSEAEILSDNYSSFLETVTLVSLQKQMV